MYDGFRLNIHLKIPYSVDKMKTMPQIPRKPEESAMLAVITRPMIVATDAGTAKQFVPVKDKKTGEDVPQPMSEAEFGRLRRAGAAQRFIEVNHAEVAGDDIIIHEDPANPVEPGTVIRMSTDEIDEVVTGIVNDPDFKEAVKAEPKGRKPKG